MTAQQTPGHHPAHLPGESDPTRPDQMPVPGKDAPGREPLPDQPDQPNLPDQPERPGRPGQPGHPDQPDPGRPMPPPDPAGQPQPAR